MADMMRAWQVMSPGPLEKKIRLAADVARPSPADLQPVLAKVVYAALNPVDYKIPELGVAARALVDFPTTPGMDMAGTIEAAKKGVAIMARLDPMKSQGALAEYVVLDEGTRATATGVDMKEAAGAVTVALTAHQCIKPYVKEGDKVFLNGGGGGLGTTGIQVAKLLGCHFCKDLGADEVIDYKKSDVTAELAKQGADMALIVDNVGNSPTDLYRRSDNILVPSGTYVYVGARMSPGTILNLSSSLMRPSWLGGQSRKFVMLMMKTVYEDLKQIAAWMADGKLKTVSDSTFEFEEAKEAYDKLKTDKCRGKVIVRVAGEEGL
ncbi:Zinc-type alcohol dehydrogenase-like protein C16A3.02c [Fusarium culmorum]|uniref:Zinc-type alcohol dehydrogenase-like protein C16A3.02c n=1 Tax=Fusarium culmorum TaxID=5516 RepID=A0A2T4GNB6_FUSCU|nr:Zinc-type alcohol dehydrogenase-like protein C16A3.02c [Fusarium culmorum]